MINIVTDVCSLHLLVVAAPHVCMYHTMLVVSVAACVLCLCVVCMFNEESESQK